MATDTLSPESATAHVSSPTTAQSATAQPTALPIPAAWLGAGVGAVVFAAFVPLLQAHAQRLWDQPHYQFVPLALLGSLALGWSFWRANATPLSPGQSGPTLVGFALAWGLLAVAEVFFVPVLAGVAFLGLLAALIYGVGGAALFRTLLPAWAFLWIAIPPPLGLDRMLVLALQNLTSHWSSAALDTLGILHLPDGNVVEISGRRLLVEEACAGLSSLFSVLACTVFLVLWLRRPWVRSLLLIVAALGWVLVCNALRVVIIAVAFDRGATDLSVGLRHDALGFACFALAVVLIWSTDRLFLFVMPRSAVLPRPAPATSPAPGLPTREALCGAARLLSWPMAVAFGLLFFLHAATYGMSAAEGPGDLLPGIASLDEKSLPQELAGWTRERFYTETRDTGSAYGEHSKFWVYKDGQRSAVVALDYPFPEFHVLNVCYINQGWTEEKTNSIRGEKAEGEPSFYVEVQLQKSAMRTGYLLYCECNQNGDYLEHEPGLMRSTWKRYETALNGWRQRVTRPADELERPKDRGPAYQFQIFVESNRPLSADDKTAAQRLYFQAVAALRKELYRAP